MEFLFVGTKFLAELVLPPTGFLIIAIIALALLRRWPRSARAVLWLSLISLLLLSLPVVSLVLNRAVSVPPMQAADMVKAQAIVVLGGGLRRNTLEYGDAPSTVTLDRIRYGAKLARETKLPILVTGGQVFGGRAEADVMAETLHGEYGTPVKWVENRARHTGENARYSATMLRNDHIDTVILVTHDYHMRRSLAQCERALLHCLPAPVSSVGAKDSWIEQMPSAGALQTSATAIHEMLGNLAIGIR